MAAREWWKDYLGPMLGLGIGVGLFLVFLWIANQQESRLLAVLVVLVGGVLGWAAGVLISPVNPKEETRFAEYGKAITTFVTGFLLAKLERVFDQAIRDFNTTVLLFVLLFVGAFLLGGLSTYIWRLYVSIQLSRPDGTSDAQSAGREASA